MSSNIIHGRAFPTTIVRTKAQAAREDSFVKNFTRKFPKVERRAKAKVAS